MLQCVHQSLVHITRNLIYNCKLALMAATKKKSLYPETSVERAAYLAANGILPIEGEWIEQGEKDGPQYVFRYEQTDKLGKLMLSYKGSKFNTLIGTFLKLFAARGKKLKSEKYGTWFPEQEMDLCKIIKEYKNPYHD